MSSSSDTKTHHPRTLPPGLELLFQTSVNSIKSSPLAAATLAVHWSVIRSTSFRLLLDPSTPPTEVLPPTWTETFLNAPTGVIPGRHFKLPYVYEDGKPVTLVIQEVVPDSMVLVMVERSLNEQFTGLTVDLKEFFNVGAVKAGEADPKKIYGARIWELESMVKDKVFKDYPDARRVVVPSIDDPYTSSLTEDQKKAIQQERDAKELAKLRKEQEEQAKAAAQQGSSPLMMPPRQPGIFPNPLGPSRGIGSADLDPFGGMLGGGGGMIMDPRGIRGQMPGGIPGARFDPFGPIGPGGGFGGGIGGGPLPRGGRMPFGGPDPDNEPMHGYSDMFS